IVVTIYSDLWLLTLQSDGHTLDSAQALTRSVGDTEVESAFLPDGNTLAYTGGPNGRFRRDVGGPFIQNLDVLTLDLGSHAITKLTTERFVDTRWPASSPDGTTIAFSAQGKRATRTSPCGGLVNYDLFAVPADGSGPATLLTNTVGTSVESFAQWGGE